MPVPSLRVVMSAVLRSVNQIIVRALIQEFLRDPVGIRGGAQERKEARELAVHDLQLLPGLLHNFAAFTIFLSALVRQLVIQVVNFVRERAAVLLPGVVELEHIDHAGVHAHDGPEETCDHVHRETLPCAEHDGDRRDEGFDEDLEEEAAHGLASDLDLVLGAGLVADDPGADAVLRPTCNERLDGLLDVNKHGEVRDEGGDIEHVEEGRLDQPF
mmetsp:Transcript_70853/g.178621  ORF Transcript_70853/g.178621 Transcript_70853/m.178621 type:complete len:215 (+) Transcript_70853:618-1262(+)